MEENLAEKISRLNRTTTARDMYDLAWIARHHRDIGGVDFDLVRRLAVLKIWVDANGVAAGDTQWKPNHDPAPFEPERWLRPRTAAEFDIGAARADISPRNEKTPHWAGFSRHVSDGQYWDRTSDPSRVRRVLECLEISLAIGFFAQFLRPRKISRKTMSPRVRPL